ncbi:APC family permease [[Mycoplasma] testudinis]|uniref:APC family permease n=1 Tax=[Mycoplasma] testudinis TaxID=33924 RepID=UPI0004811286|nr:APC family permease [[Mycoplasma] testudinis]
MKVQSARKLGFWAALAVVIGNVVGIGIFLKNLSVVNFATIIPQPVNGAGDPIPGEFGTFSFYSVLVSWIVGAVITFFAALSFAEVSTSRASKAGLAGWSEQLGGRRFGRFVRFNHTTFYYAILVAALPFLAVQGLYSAIDIGVNGRSSGQVHFGYIFLGGAIILVSFIALNLFATKSSAVFQYASIFFKIVPLVLVFIIGLINANQSDVFGKTAAEVNASPLAQAPAHVPGLLPVSTFNVGGMFSALPAVFFTFDAYVTVGNMADDVKNPHRNIPLAIVFGIIIAAVIYIVISVGAGLTGFGNASDIMQTLIPSTAANVAMARQGLAIFILVFISLSAFGVVNTLTLVTIKSNESLIEEGQVMGYQFLQKMNNKTKHSGTLILMALTSGVYFIVVGIFGSIYNTDALSDSITNIPVLFFFLVYAIVITLAFVDRFTKKQCHRVWGFWVAAPIAAVCIYAAFAYQFFVSNIVDPAQNPFARTGNGLFFTNNPWFNWQNTILFWVLLIIFIVMPVVNHFVIKKTGGYGNDAKNEFNKVATQLNVITV